MYNTLFTDYTGALHYFDSEFQYGESKNALAKSKTLFNQYRYQRTKIKHKTNIYFYVHKQILPETFFMGYTH